MALRIWLPLDGNTNNQGLENVTVTNINATIDNNGKIGKCYYFDGASSRIACSSFTCQYPMSIAAWIKPTDVTNTNTQYWLSYNTSTGGTAGHAIAFGTYTGKFAIWYGGNCATAVTTPAIENDKWYHIALVITADKKAYTYINGNKHGPVTFTTAQPASAWFTVGARSNSSTGSVGDALYKFKGYANDVRFYDEALSDEQVKLISQGLVLHYPLSREGFGQDNIIPSSTFQEKQYTYPASSYSNKYHVATKIVPSASQYTLSFYAKSTVNGDVIQTYFYDPNTTTASISSQGKTNTLSDGHMQFTLTTDWKLYWVTYTQSETTDVKHIICPRLFSSNGTGTVSVKMVKLEEGDKATPWMPNSDDNLYASVSVDNTIVHDVSGYKHRGEIIAGTSYSSDTSKHNVCMEFDGLTQGIIIRDLNISSILNNNCTISFWIKPEDTSRSIYFSANNSTTWAIEQYNNKLRSWWNGNPNYYSEFDIDLNVWQHIVITKDENSVQKFYKNGEFKEEHTDTLANLTFGTTWRIGRDFRYNDGTPYQGLMSDFRLYATALSDEDIMKLYKNSNIIS